MTPDKTDPTLLNILLNAQRSLAQAESDYFRSVTNYAKSISQVHYRKGSLLEYNGVYLTEGPWPAKAYFDARRRARSRSAALYLDYGFTYPKVLSQGPIPQFSGKAMGAEETTGQGTGCVARARRRSRRRATVRKCCRRLRRGRAAPPRTRRVPVRRP